jgi:hypothetical protein
MQSTGYKKTLYNTLLIIIAIAGAFTANIIYPYEILVSGVLGIAFLFSLFRKRPRNNSGTIEELLLQTGTEKLKGFVYVFTISFAMFLSFMVIMKMVTTSLKLITLF